MRRLFVPLVVAGALMGPMALSATAATPAVDPSILPAAAQQAFEADRTIPEPARKVLPNGKTLLEWPAKQVSVRKATQTDVASGLAASTASSVYLCVDTVALDNPNNGQYDGRLGLKAAYETSFDGRYVNVRIVPGNSLFVFSNHTDNFYVYWSRALYQGSTVNVTADVVWANQFGIYNYVGPGGQSGMHINSSGYTDNTAAWRQVGWYASGWRHYVPFQTVQGVVEQEATVTVQLWSNDRLHAAWVDTYIKPSLGGGCGSINRTIG